LLTESAECVAGVLQQFLKPTRATGIAAHFLHLFGTTESEPGFAPGLCRRVPAGDQSVFVLIQMEAQLLFELFFHPRSMA
jgi:hypothetical protein